MGNTKATLNINGDTSGESQEVIDLDSHSGFELADANSVLNLNDIKLTGNSTLVNVSNSGAKLNIKDVTLDGGIDASSRFAMSTSGTSEFKGEVKNADISNTGTLTTTAENISSSDLTNSSVLKLSGTLAKTIAGNGETQINSALTLNDGAAIDGKLNLNNSSLTLSEGLITEHNIGSLAGTGNMAIDLNLSQAKADKINLTDSASVAVTLTGVNILDPSVNELDKNFKVDLFNLGDNTGNIIQLALSDEVASALDAKEYIIDRGDASQTQDAIQATSSWTKDLYKQHITSSSTTYGKLGVSDDELGLSVHQTRVEGGSTTHSSLGDTLKLVNQDTINAVKNFNATSDGDIYKVTENLGNTKATLNINGDTSGESQEVIDLDSHSGFELADANSVLNLNDIVIKNAGEWAIRSTVSGARINLNNVSLLSGNGGIESHGTLNISADNYESVFAGNRAGNALLVTGADLNLTTVNGGKIVLNDNVTSIGGDINISGDGSSEVVINSKLSTDGKLGLSANSVTHIGTEAGIDVGEMKAVSGNLITAQALTDRPTLKLDVEVDRNGNSVKIGNINVRGELSGNYNVVVNSLNQYMLADNSNAVVKFLSAENDTNPDDESFDVIVKNSPYQWFADRNINGETSGSTWYLNLANDDNKNPLLRPEVIAGAGLHEAAIEQTRSIFDNVKNKIASGRGYCPHCGVYSDEWNGRPLRNVWVLAQGEYADIDKTVDMKAKIKGVEGGFDIQSDVHNTLGVFASYRDGKYDLNGKSSKGYAIIGSDIDIDSFAGGLYYRFDKNNSYVFAALYGGIQRADIKSDDSSVKFDTDGIEFGGGIEVGHTFALQEDLTIEPSVGIRYTQVNFDSAKDNLDKDYKWSDISHIEAELGAKLTKQFEEAGLYVKPAIIQTLSSNDRVSISGLNKLDTYHDQTLARFEVGGRYGFTDAISGYLWSNYTFGSSYKSGAFGLGVNYSW